MQRLLRTRLPPSCGIATPQFHAYNRNTFHSCSIQLRKANKKKTLPAIPAGPIDDRFEDSSQEQHHPTSMSKSLHYDIDPSTPESFASLDDPLELTEFKNKLSQTLEKMRKDAATIKQQRSDPEFLNSLQVELPATLGGTTVLREVANAGQKPGDARALLISVFDPEVSGLPPKYV
jgi:hypothetical protein